MFLSFTKFFTEGINTGKTIIIFAGRFQPWHVGHKHYYESAKLHFPQADFYIATSDPNPKLVLKEPDRYPFNFDEKKRIIMATGISSDEIVKTVQPYKPIEILDRYDPYNDKVIFLVGKKDMEEDPRFRFKPTSYFQPLNGINNAKSFNPDTGHGYVYAPGTITFSIDGNYITSASELRKLFITGDKKTRKRIIMDVVGHFDDTIYNLFCMKLLK